MSCRSRRAVRKCTELASLAFPWQYEADEKLILVLLKAGLPLLKKKSHSVCDSGFSEDSWWQSSMDNLC